MKVLHPFSDWKWTGAAEPTVILCEALQKRGHQVTLAYRVPSVEAQDSIANRILGKYFQGTDQFQFRPLGEFYRGYALTDSLRDLRSPCRFIDREGFDLVNVHHSHDHILGEPYVYQGKDPAGVSGGGATPGFELFYRNIVEKGPVT